jgi:hypothetical protein
VKIWGQYYKHFTGVFYGRKKLVALLNKQAAQMLWTSGKSTVVKHSPHHLKEKGSGLACAAATGREKNCMKWVSIL